MKIAIVCCLHGNETYGLEVVERLPLPFFIGNKKALIENKRFLESDMNRIFPGKKNGGYEEKEVYKLNKKLKNFDYLIDLHSTSNDCPLFGIITKSNKEKIEFAKKLGLNRLVIMPKEFASGRALIDFVKCGISLEIGSHGNKIRTWEVIGKIKGFIEGRDFKNQLIVYEAFEIIKRFSGKVLIENFKKVKKGEKIVSGYCDQFAGFDFIPVLVDEDAYPEVLCLACRKLDLNSKK